MKYDLKEAAVKRVEKRLAEKITENDGYSDLRMKDLLEVMEPEDFYNPRQAMVNILEWWLFDKSNRGEVVFAGLISSCLRSLNYENEDLRKAGQSIVDGIGFFKQELSDGQG